MKLLFSLFLMLWAASSHAQFANLSKENDTVWYCRGQSNVGRFHEDRACRTLFNCTGNIEGASRAEMARIQFPCRKCGYVRDTVWVAASAKARLLHGKATCPKVRGYKDVIIFDRSYVKYKDTNWRKCACYKD